MPRERTPEDAIAHAVTLYNRGVLCLGEVLNQVADQATRPGFAEGLARLDGLPAGALAELMERASNPPEHPEDVLGEFAIDPSLSAEDAEEADRRMRVRHYWTFRILFEHFAPGRTCPEFEPIRCIGSVTGSSFVDGLLAILGVEHPELIRRHPIRLVTPTGVTIGASLVRRDLVRDGMSPRLQTRCLLLAPDVRSPSEVPPGTEVWIDRSAAAAIPPL